MALHVVYKTKLEELAERLLADLRLAWTEPFNEPVVIFPNNRLEQWFKQYALTRMGAVANLNCRRMDRFVMDYLTRAYRRIPGNEDKVIVGLSPEIFAHAIIAYFKTADCRALERAEYAPVKKYCCREEGKIDERKLFDFAYRLASLYLEYELSRPRKSALYGSGDDVGLLDAWKGVAPKFFGEKDAAKEAWQHRLYADILQCGARDVSFMDKIFAAARPGEARRRVCLTLPYLFREVEGKEVTPEKEGHSKIFIFGIEGMGQYYYVALKEIARKCEIYAYVPNPCMQFWEDMLSSTKTAEARAKALMALKAQTRAQSCFAGEEEAVREDIAALRALRAFAADGDKLENALLQKWGFYGRDTVRMWNLIDDYQTGYDDEGDGANAEDMTLLSAVQYLISQRKNTLDEEPLAKLKSSISHDRSLVVRSAPSRVREVEALHTDVCQLLEKGARLDEMLVVSPSIADYATAIHRVFDIHSNAETVHIAYRILDGSTQNSLAAGALATLFALAAKHDFNRSDFFALITNPVVQSARKITAADVAAFEKWTAEMGVYRNGTLASKNRLDWPRAVKRLLLATFSGENLPLSSADGFDVLRPYEDIASAGEATLERFTGLIDDLTDWLEFTRESYTPERENGAPIFSSISSRLKKWIFMDPVSAELQGENYVFTRAMGAFEALKVEFLGGRRELPFSVIERTILSGIENTQYSCGEVFVGGLSFMKFKANEVLPAKHVFFLGANAKSFPGEHTADSLDLRQHLFWPGDASTGAKNKYGFLNLLVNAASSFTISYVNKDLVKDEDLYASSVVNDLKSFVEKMLGADLWREQKISLDETRCALKLYTSRARRARRLGQMLHLGPQEKTLPPSGGAQRRTHELPGNLTISQLRRFLEEPCSFQVSRRLCREAENRRSETIEPIFLSNSGVVNAVKLIFKALVKAQRLEVAELGEAQISSVVEHTLKSRALMPNGVYGNKVAEELKTAVKGLIADMTSAGIEMGKLEVEEKCALDLGTWKLEGNLDWHTPANEEGCLSFVGIAGSADEVKLLNLYVSALAFVSSLPEKEYTASLQVFTPVAGKSCKRTFAVRPTGARELLEKIYAKAVREGFAKAIAFELWGAKIADWDDYKAKMTLAWRYFDKRLLFDFEELCGFTPADFAAAWPQSVQSMRQLVAFAFGGEEK